MKVLRKVGGTIARIYQRFKIIIGIALGIMLLFFAHSAIEYTSTDVFCDVCHVHPHVTDSWKLSTHYKNKSGVIVHCVQCHLPPEGFSYYTEKAKTGLRDVWGTVFKDATKFDWEAKSRLEPARKFTYDESCTHCHAELFSLNLSKKGEDAHVYYFHRKAEVRCINCHLTVGHYREEIPEEVRLAETTPEATIQLKLTIPVPTDKLVDYIDAIPGTEIAFEMVAIPGGSFKMGSPESEPFHEADEGPVHEVKINSFWMGKAEVSWNEWEAYYSRMGSHSSKYASSAEVDAVTGPTPPYGTPDQGWGKGTRPAITMTHFAATKYCEWLSSITGRKYRLPTEAEWEYACRGGTSGPYFFDADPSKLSERSFRSKIFGADTSGINQYVWYQLNSQVKTHPPYTKKSNPFGLLNMLGNVREFCLDWYNADAYSQYSSSDIIADPCGPESGEEHVVRGGSIFSDAADLRCANRDYTQNDKWMMTDPQMPKSKWWYSDVFDVGFRIVREFDGDTELEMK